MVFYIVKRQDGSIDNRYFGAYMTKEMAQLAINIWEEKIWDTELKYVDTIDVKSSRIGRHILFCRFYRGYDYNYGKGGMVDISSDSGFAANLIDLKKTGLYRQCLSEIEQGDENKYLKLPDGSIGCRDDLFSQSLFYYGDIMEGKWSLVVEKLRIYKGDEAHLQDHLQSLYNKRHFTIQ